MSDSSWELSGPAAMLVGVVIPEPMRGWGGLGVFLDFLPNRRFNIVKERERVKVMAVRRQMPRFRSLVAD
jgi:hypothetical protein